MNEQAIKDAYDLFVSNGYTKSIDDFKKLMSTNQQALQDAHELFVQNGYTKDINNFKALMGVGQIVAEPKQAPISIQSTPEQSIAPDKKKVTTASGLVSGSLELPKSPIDAQSKPIIASTTVAKKPIKEGVTGTPTPADDDKQGWFLNTVSSFDKGVYKNLIGNPIKGLGTLMQGATAKITGGDGRAFISDALIKFGDSYNKMIDDLTPQDEEFKGSVSDQFGQAFGQVLALVLTANATGAAGAAGKGAGAIAQAAPKASATVEAAKQLVSGMANPTSVSAALSMGQSEFDRAKEAGATDEQAFEAFYKNAITGSILERIPVMHFLERFNKASAGGVMNYIKTKGVGGLKGGLEEMTTEILQQIYANATAKDIYNINQDLLEGVGESGGVGFGVGFLLNAMGAQAKILRKQGKTEEADVIDAQVESFKNDMEDKKSQPVAPVTPGKYTVNGLPIPNRDVMEETIMTGPVDELIALNINIENDDDLKMKLQKRIVEHSIGQQIKQANPNLSDEIVSKMVPLERELQTLQGNTTQIGKDRANEIRSQLKNLQQNAVQEQTAGEVSVQSKTGSGEEVAQGEPKSKPQSATQESQEQKVVLNTLNPTGSVFATYSAEQIDKLPLGENMTTYAETAGVDPNQTVTVYRGVPNEINEIRSGDFVTTNEQLARDYAGTGKVISMQVKASEIIDDKTEPLGEEYLLRIPSQEVASVEQAENKRTATKFSWDNLRAQPLSVLEQKLIEEEENLPGIISMGDEIEIQRSQSRVDALKSQIELAKQEVSSKTSTEQRVNIAPFFNTTVANREEAKALRQTPEYKSFIDTLSGIAAKMGVKATITEGIGGYRNDAGEEIVEISNVVVLDNADIDTAEEYAALAAALAPEVQEASIAAQYVDEASENHNANEYVINVGDIDGAIEALNEAGIKEFSVNEDTGTVSFIDVLDFADEELQNKIGRFLEVLEEKQISYEQSEFRPLESRYVDKGTRKKILGRIKSQGPVSRQSGQELLQATDQAIERDSGFQGLTIDEYLAPEPETQAEPMVDLNELMTADTREQSTLEKVDAFLGKLEADIDAFGKGTMGVNIALPVVKAIIKTVRALVKSGITLQEAIRRAAAQNNVSEEDVIGVLNQLANQTYEASKTEGTSEVELPGYNRLMSEAEGVVEKSLERDIERNLALGFDEAKAMKNAVEKALENVIAYVQGSRVYQDATDVQRDQLIRDVREILNKREKSAPKADKLLGKEKTMVTMDEMDALKSQLRMEARAAREAKNDMNAKRRALADVVRKMASNGLLTAKKAATLLNKISKLNLYNNEMVERFIDYAGKVFADAEYGTKLTIANAARKRLRKMSKNADKAANLRALASQFIELDPSMVEDIDKYNAVASKIVESLTGSRMSSSSPKFANIIRENDAMAYISDALATQQQKLYEMKIAEIKELLGVDATGLKYEDLVDILTTDKKTTKDDEALARAVIQRAFNVYAAAINEMIKTGKDLFTGEDIEFTDMQIAVIKDFMNMDLNVMKAKDALMAVDALLNFIQNGSTAKMEAVYRKNVAEVNLVELARQGIRAEPLRKYFSQKLGRLLTEQLANLNILFERMFKGFSRGGMVERLSGLTDVKNGKARAQIIANKIADKYVEQFYKRTANGQAFNTAFNAVERGMTAFLSRTVMGTDKERRAEFERRKGLVKQSIAALMKGDKKEQEKGRIYQEVYDKLVVDKDTKEDVKTIDEVLAKVDQTNLEAIDFWRQEWADKFEELSNVSLNVYNKILEKDFNYVPDRFVNLSSNTGKIDLTADEMAFHINNGTLYKKSTGVLMEATRPTELPQNENNEEPGMFIDLSFDKANANAMYDALVDINTAAAIRQLDAFIKSPRLRTIVPNPEDVRVLQRRINLFVNNIRNKNPYTSDELSDGIRRLNRVAAFGVGQALGGLTQPLKQVIPVATNTLINAKALDISAAFDKAKNDFMNRSGFSIATRGVESQAQIESLNKLMDEAANGNKEKILKALEFVNNKYLQTFLVKPDIVIARATWMTYYEQSLVEQGIDPDTIDYNTHQPNQEAGDYAQRMVDRQQNVSDADLAGALLSSKEEVKQLVTKMLMPFASFRMNQSARLGTDMAVLMSNVSTVEDKKIAMRSLAGFAAEMLTFRIISTGISIAIASAVKAYMDREDDEEKDKKKLNSIVKGQATGMVNDIFSPAPLLDKGIQIAVGTSLEKVQDLMEVAEDDRISIYTDTQQSFAQSLGLFGISLERATQIAEISYLAAGGAYKDKYGRDKYLSENDREALKPLIPVSMMIGLGLMPSEMNSFTRSALSDAKRNASTKEGGKDSMEQAQERELDKLREERAAEKEQNTAEKVSALKKLKQDVTDPQISSEINKMINEYSMSPEQRKASKERRAAEKRQRDAELENLLKGYDNKSEMKRYDPDLYEKTFGEGSNYYEKNKAKIEAEKLLRKKIQELEDIERNYSPRQKQKRFERPRPKRRGE